MSGWALQGDSGVGHLMESLGLGTPGTPFQKVWRWAFQEVSGVGHSRESRGVERARRRVPGEEKS